MVAKGFARPAGARPSRGLIPEEYHSQPHGAFPGRTTIRYDGSTIVPMQLIAVIVVLGLLVVLVATDSEQSPPS